jgi:hypothetical protein
MLGPWTCFMMLTHAAAQKIWIWWAFVFGGGCKYNLSNLPNEIQKKKLKLLSKPNKFVCRPMLQLEGKERRLTDCVYSFALILAGLNSKQINNSKQSIVSLLWGNQTST